MSFHRMVDRDGPYIPKRGVPLDTGVVPRIPAVAPSELSYSS